MKGIEELKRAIKELVWDMTGFSSGEISDKIKHVDRIIDEFEEKNND